VESGSGKVLSIQKMKACELMSSTVPFDCTNVLYSKLRPNLNKVVVPNNSGYCTSELLPLKPDPKRLDRGYLAHYLRSPEFVAWAVSRTDGAKMPRVKMDVLREHLIPLPELIEQRRIVAILDKADAIRTKRREILNLADDFLRSVFLDMFGDPVTNSKGWQKLPLRDCSDRIQIGPFGTQLHQEDYIEGGVPIVNPTHIVDGKICVNNSLSISKKLHAKLPEYHLAKDDVIMGRRGEMGRCALVTEVESGFMCGTGSLFIRSDKAKVQPDYLLNVLSSPSAKLTFERASLGATMPNLNKGIVSNFEIGIPPIAYQEQFSELVAINSRLNKNLVIAMVEANALFTSLQQHAFSGLL